MYIYEFLTSKLLFHLLFLESIHHQNPAHFIILWPGVISLHLNIQVLLNFTDIFLRLSFGKHVL